jgi:hypothetical protein
MAADPDLADQAALATHPDIDPTAARQRWIACRRWLARAHQDFIESDARTEKVFRVFHTSAGCHAFVSIDSLTPPSPTSS